MLPYKVLSYASTSQIWIVPQSDDLAFLFRPNATPRMLAVQPRTIGIACLPRRWIDNLFSQLGSLASPNSGTTSLKRRTKIRVLVVQACCAVSSPY